MPLIQHVLSATDLSPLSLAAVDRAHHLAVSAGAEHTVVHALGLDAIGSLRQMLGADEEAITQTVLGQERKALEDALAERDSLARPLPNIRVERRMAAQLVPQLAQDLKVDLIALGARGHNSLRRLFLGSTASHLLRRCHCPTLIVHQPCSGAYQRVLVPIDFSSASSVALEWIKKVSPRAEIVLLHAFDVPFEGMLSRAGVERDTIHHYRIEARERVMRDLRQLASDAGLQTGQYTPLVEHGDPATLIIRQQERLRCDLVIMGKHGTHVTEDLLLGSVTKHVLSEANCDILIVSDRA